jgi:hypothetical protein
MQRIAAIYAVAKENTEKGKIIVLVESVVDRND